MLGIDIDHEPMFSECIHLHNLRRLAKSVQVKKTRKGYHFYFDIDVTPEVGLLLRYIVDDPLRVSFDEARLKAYPELVDVLFEAKLTFNLVIRPDGSTFMKDVTFYAEQDVNFSDLCF